MTTLSLPVYTTSLVGRARETAALVELINDPEIQLVTLTGTSGTGKTRLSTEVALTLHEQGYQVVFVPLAAINNAIYVIPTIAHYLDVPDHGETPLTDLIIEGLQAEPQPMLLILDNFEQVLTAAPALEPLIKSLPHLTILVTSQVKLGLTSETHYDIPGLAIPDQVPEDPTEALNYSAIQLFVERIQVVQPTFQFSEDQIKPIIEICRLVEGLPLAIEIVAAHSDILAPADLKLLVNQHLRIYRYRNKRATGRQRIILPIIEWSLLRLSEQPQALFNHLGVFQGGWMIDALEYVMQPQQYALQAALDILVKRHLILTQTVIEEPLHIRYMMLDAVQDFADTRFGQHPLAYRHSIIERQLDFMQDLSHRARQDLVQGQQRELWMPRLEHEIHNIRFLLEWSINHKPQAALELIKNLGSFWYIGAYAREAMEWYDQVIAAAEPTIADRAFLASQQVNFLVSLAEYQKAIEIGTAGLEYAQTAQDTHTEARICNTLGVIHSINQQPDQARNYLYRCLEAARRSEHTTLVFASLTNLAVMESNDGNYAQAIVMYEEIYELAQANQNVEAQEIVLANLANAYLQQGLYVQALEYIDKTIEHAKHTNKQGYMQALHIKARICVRSGKPGAKSLLLQSINLYNDVLAPYELLGILDSAALYFEQHGQLTTTGHLIGAADQMEKELREEEPVEPVMLDMYARVQGQPVYEQAYAEGATWSIEQAIEYLVTELERSPHA